MEREYRMTDGRDYRPVKPAYKVDGEGILIMTNLSFPVCEQERELEALRMFYRDVPVACDEQLSIVVTEDSGVTDRVFDSVMTAGPINAAIAFKWLTDNGYRPVMIGTGTIKY